MTVDEVVNIYMTFRKTLSVSDAADSTINQLSITPPSLVDAFNAAQLDLTRSNEEAEVIRDYRNELLTHFSPKK